MLLFLSIIYPLLATLSSLNLFSTRGGLQRALGGRARLQQPRARQGGAKQPAAGEAEHCAAGAG